MFEYLYICIFDNLTICKVIYRPGQWDLCVLYDLVSEMWAIGDTDATKAGTPLSQLNHSFGRNICDDDDGDDYDDADDDDDGDDDDVDIQPAKIVISLQFPLWPLCWSIMQLFLCRQILDQS